MKSTRYALLVVLLMIISAGAFGQDKPRRIGVKIGIPNVTTVNVEYVLPVLGNKIGISADFLALTPSFSDVELSFSYWEIGANYYITGEGKGLYAGIGYGGFKSDMTISNIESDQDPSLTNGTATSQYNFGSLNLKIGAKLGGLIYFRPEIGYGLGARDEQLTVDVSFPNGASETQTIDIPSWASSGLIANIGIGVSF
jgi:hypothetical protein